MKKNYFFKLFLLLIPVSAFLLMSSSGGRTDGRSGSPGDGGVSCTQCHTGGSSGVSANITTNIPNTGYELNTDYSITVKKSSSAAGGFQLVAENDSNTKVGSFIASSNTKVSGDRITHKTPNSSSWSFTWRSPSSDKGNIKFYSSVVIANGDGSNGSGDKAVNINTSGSTVLAVTKENRLNFEIFPNPTSEILTIQLPSESDNAIVEFYDYLGRLALTKKVTNSDNKINVNDLFTGVYVLKVLSENRIGSQKFIKQ